MLAFITSMRHPDNAEDYAYNEALLEMTLKSLSNQTSTDYVVIIVGNRAPSFVLPERVHFVPVDFAPPPRINGPHADRSGFVRDKGSKIGVGLLAARQFSPDWVMIFDADDFVHRDLVDFVEKTPSTAGWVVADGLIYSRSRNGYRRQPGFNRTCGTSYVIPYDVYGVPDDLGLGATQDEVVQAYGEVLPHIMGAHRNATQWHRDRGRRLSILPFAGAVYHVDTGENHSGKALAGVIRPWGTRLDRDFAIAPSRSRAQTWFASVGPRAVAQSAGALFARVLARAARLTRKASRGSGGRDV